MSTKYLNSDNILKKVYDPATEGLRTTAVASFIGGTVEIAISDTTDSIKIGDGTGTYLDINPDGSINVKLGTVTDLDIRDLNANQDNILFIGTENGAIGGTQHAARIDSGLDLRVGISNGNNKALVNLAGQLSVIDTDANTLLNDIKTKLNGTLSVDDDASQILLNSIYTVLSSGTIEVNDINTQTLITTANTILNSILTQLNSGTLKVDDDQTQSLLTNILSQLQAGGIAIGTEDGTATGTQHVFVNNLRKMIMDSADRAGVISYLDISDKKNRRIDKIDYTSATFPGITASKQFTYTLVSGDYVRTSPGNWYLI